MADARTQTVRAGYDAMADRFAEWGGRVEGDPRDRFLSRFIDILPASGSVLDLGCGAGVPSTVRLAERFRVVGVDISEAQLARARRNLPAAELLRADILDVAFPEASFDGVAAFYSIAHVPREHHGLLFAKIARWLRPGGVFLASLGVGDMEGWVGEWLGVPMFFSSHSSEVNRRLLEEAGLGVVHAEAVTMREPDGEATFHWVICRAPGPGQPANRSPACSSSATTARSRPRRFAS